MTAMDSREIGTGGRDPADAVPSPCVGTCLLDAASGYCLGCARTGAEIAEWRGATEERRRAVWRLLPRRSAALGLGLTRLPWSRAEILRFVADSVRARSGTWVLGCHGALAELVLTGARSVVPRISADTISVEIGNAALRLGIDESVRALVLGPSDAAPGERTVVLAVERASPALPVATALTALGPDRDAISAAGRHERLYDLGIGRGATRFCVRSAVPGLTALLDETAGARWPDWLARAGAALVSQSPTRVVETALGRLEVSAPIPAADETTPVGPHTHLQPELLAQGRETPPGVDLPPAYTLGAMFYPEPTGLHAGADPGTDVQPI